MTHLEQRTTETMEPELSIPQGEDVCIVEDGIGTSAGERTTVLTVGENAHVLYALHLAPKANLQRSITIRLQRNATLELSGIIAAAAGRSIVCRLSEDHTDGPSTSRTSIRGLLAVGASLDIRGAIAIQKSADGSNAYLESRSTLLGAGAKATMIPALEIHARDVKARHAAAAGPIDPEAFFYCASRGISEEEAKPLMLQGFASAVAKRIPDQNACRALLERWQKVLTTL